MDYSVSEFIVCTCRAVSKSNINVFDSIHSQAVVALDQYTMFCGSCAEFFIQPLRSCVDDVDCFLIKPETLAFTDENIVMPYEFRHISHPIDCFLMEPYVVYPAFVRLRFLGQMRYNRESRTFEFIQKIETNILATTEIIEIIANENDESWCRVGPARKLSEMIALSDEDRPSREGLSGPLSFDMVKSMWCPQWPIEAEEWPNRQRKYGLPTTAIIHEIVQNGCHVVNAKHPACRNDIHQFRLSFSVAELILLQSWTQTQQIVYHMFRFFAKRELIQKGRAKDDEVLCTYHFKTLMLWSCEEMSPDWWNSTSVIKICSNLFEKLSQWLKQIRCPNYFIPQANLFHERFNQKIVDETVETLTRYCDADVLSLWFMEHYLLRNFLEEGIYDKQCIPYGISCVHGHMLQIFKDMKADLPGAFDFYISSRSWLDAKYAQHTVKEGYDWTCLDFYKYIFRIGSLFEDKFACRLCAEFEACYSFYGSMLHILHAARLLDCKEMISDSEWFVEEIRQVSEKPKRLRSKHHNLPRPSNISVNRRQSHFIKAQDSIKTLTGSNCELDFRILYDMPKELLRNALGCEDSKANNMDGATFPYKAFLHDAYRRRLFFYKAGNLMENLTGSNDHVEFQILSKISNGLLMKAMDCKGSETNTIAMAALSYVAALHYSAPNYQIVIDLCSRVIVNENPEKKETETLDAGCLLYIEDISKIIGFYLIFLKAKNPFLQYTRRQIFIDLRLTPKVLALYLTISSIEKTTETFVSTNISQTATFPLDAILIAISNRKLSRLQTKSYGDLRVCQRSDPMEKTEAAPEVCLQNEEAIIRLLMEYSLEKIASFDNEVFKDFGIHCNTADCYRAAYLYQCRNYPEVLNLCDRILDEPDVQQNLKELAFANVMVLPPLDSFFDEEIRGLLGFHTLFCYLSTPFNELWNIGQTFDTAFNQFLVQIIQCEKGILFTILHEEYVMVRHYYFIGRHFLARYLKVRCMLDYFNSLSEATLGLKKLKASLPFEHFIHRFLQQKIAQLQKDMNAE